MSEQYAVIFDKDKQVTIATCNGCGESIELDYSENARETSDRAIQWGREHALCVAKESVEAVWFDHEEDHYP